MPEPAHDYSKYKAGPEDEVLNKIVKGANRQDELVLLVKEADAKLKALKAEYQNHEQFYMPSLMEEATLDEFTRDKLTVKVMEKMRASVSEERRVPAYKWLTDNGEARLIKTQFLVDIDTLDNEGVDYFEYLLEGMEGINYSFSQSHNANSLTATIKKKMEAGDEVPQKVFGVYRQKFCKLTRKK